MSKYADWTSLLPAACLWYGELTSLHLLSFTGPWVRKEGATGKETHPWSWDMKEIVRPCNRHVNNTERNWQTISRIFCIMLHPQTPDKMQISPVLSILVGTLCCSVCLRILVTAVSAVPAPVPHLHFSKDPPCWANY